MREQIDGIGAVRWDPNRITANIAVDILGDTSDDELAYPGIDIQRLADRTWVAKQIAKRNSISEPE